MAPWLLKRMFKPGRSVPDNLLCYAIAGKHATLAMRPVISEDEATQVAVSLVRLSRTGFTSNNILCLLHPLKLKGKVRWDSSFPIVPKTRLDRSAWYNRFTEAGTKPLNITFLGCPGCEKVESSSNTKFQLGYIDKKLQCKACKTHSVVNVKSL